ncbi:MAG: ABC transporter permease [Bacteroidia bacterium]|nr:ABC transporter permease [Bacteroidia bacterium]
MIKNYFITAIRNLWRNKFFSVINILGLSVGIASCMLIFLYGKDEISFDGFHKNKQNIYRITADMLNADGLQKMGSTGMMPGPNFKRQVPEVEDFVRVRSAGFNIKQGTNVIEQDALYVDENFFSVFSFPLIQGNAKTVLKDMHSVVLSQDVAEKYFGKKNPIGQTLQLNTGEKFESFVVSGLAKNSPQNSSIKIQMLVPMKFDQSQYDDNNWVNFFLNTFVVLKSGSNAKSIEEKFNKIYKTEAADQLKEMEEKYGSKDQILYGLQPLLQMHLSTDYPADNGLSGASNPIYSYILSGIAAFVLLIACINFINLTVARSIKRGKEIGIRKVIGGQRKQLIIQFLGESFVLSFFSFLLAIGIAFVSLPFFNAVSDKELSFSYLLDTKLIAGYIALFIVTSLLAGFYPALVLSRFKPVDTLYGKLRFSRKNFLSKGLVVLQFSLATFLIIATITIYSQFSYLVNYDLGYDGRNVMVVRTASLNFEKLAVLKNELAKQSAITAVTADQGGGWSTYANVNGETQQNFDYKCVDENFIGLFKIPVIKGRNFSKDFPTDTMQSVIVNETFAKTAGWKNPIGEIVDFFYNKKKYSVIGVVKDYHFASLNQKITPQLFMMSPQREFHRAFIKILPGNKVEAMRHVEKTFRSLYPEQPYQFTFKEAENEEQYVSESKWKQIITFSAILTIFISCIGLFGLTALSAEKRAKEIGIRKVLGASVSLIVKNLSGDFLKLVIIAACIASPFAWWIMNKWLENYPYRIAMKGSVFGVAIGGVLLIALLTVSYQALKAAIANPVKSLRTE